MDEDPEFGTGDDQHFCWNLVSKYRGESSAHDGRPGSQLGRRSNSKFLGEFLARYRLHGSRKYPAVSRESEIPELTFFWSTIGSVTLTFYAQIMGAH